MSEWGGGGDIIGRLLIALNLKLPCMTWSFCLIIIMLVYLLYTWSANVSPAKIIIFVSLYSSYPRNDFDFQMVVYMSSRDYPTCRTYSEGVG